MAVAVALADATILVVDAQLRTLIAANIASAVHRLALRCRGEPRRVTPRRAGRPSHRYGWAIRGASQVLYVPFQPPCVY